MKTIVITTATSDLGYETARILARDLNNKLILGSQDQQEAQAVVARLCSESGNQNIACFSLNLASLRSIHLFVEKILISKNSIDVLACTGGYQNHPSVNLTPDGLAKVFMVNHLGQFLLTRLLMPYLDPESGRIVLVSGDSHYVQAIRPSVFSKIPPPDYRGWDELFRSPDLRIYLPHLRAYVRYATSKLCVFFFGYELNRRLRDKKSAVTVNLFDPMISPDSILNRIFTHRNSIQEASKCFAGLLIDSSFKDVTGQFFQGSVPKDSSTHSYDQGNWQDLWEGSEILTKGPFNIFEANQNS